jgi:hypothetical protein
MNYFKKEMRRGHNSDDEEEDSCDENKHPTYERAKY